MHDSAHLQYAEREVREYSAGPEALNGGSILQSDEERGDEVKWNSSFWTVEETAI